MKLSVILEAIDKVTKPVRAIAATVRSLNSRLGLGSLVGSVGKVGKAFGEVGKAARETAVRVTAAVGLIAGGLFGLVKASADAGDAANDGAAKIGISVIAYQRLGYAAKLAGSDQDELTNGLRFLSKNISAATHGNQTMAENFKRLGVAVKDAHGKILPTDQIFAQIAGRFSKMPDGAKKSALAMEIFGDAGANLVQLLNTGSQGLKDMGDEAERLGYVMSEDGVNAAGDFNDALDRSRIALGGLRNVIAEKLYPALTPLIKGFTDWIVANRQLIATRVGEFIKTLPGIIDRLKASAVSLYQRLQPVVGVLSAIVRWIGPVNAAAIALTAIFAGKLIISIWQLTTAFGGLTKALVKTTYALARIALAPLIETIGAFVLALRSGIGIVEAFNIALAANPIGLVITAIVALAAAVYLIYKNWGTIGPWFNKLWSDVKAIFSRFSDWIEKTFVSAITDTFMALSKVIQPIIDGIEAGLNAAKSVGNIFSSQSSGSGGATPAGRMAGFRGLGAASFKPSSTAASLDAGGTVTLRLENGRASVTQAKPNDSRMNYQVDSGTVMR